MVVSEDNHGPTELLDPDCGLGRGPCRSKLSSNGLVNAWRNPTGQVPIDTTMRISSDVRST